MVRSNQSQARGLAVVDPLYVSVIVYTVLCVPMYFWLEGPVGGAGTVDPSVVVGGLTLGSILFVPVIKSTVERAMGRTGRFRMGGPMEDGE